MKKKIKIMSLSLIALGLSTPSYAFLDKLNDKLKKIQQGGSPPAASPNARLPLGKAG